MSILDHGYIPATPQDAFRWVERLAKGKGYNVKSLCIKLGKLNQAATVYRWKNNSKTYDIGLFLEIVRRTRRLKHAKQLAKNQRGRKSAAAAVRPNSKEKTP